MKDEDKKGNFDYISEAHVTASANFHEEKVPMGYYAEVLACCITSLQDLDKIKKALFYGRDLGFPVPAGATTVKNIVDWVSDHTSEDAEAINIIHGIIGVATEAGELLEVLFKTTVEGKPLDKVNIGEEIGDCFWYDALLLRAIGSNFTHEQRRNIQKLRYRYPEKFNEFDANNRDLFGEREILEKD